MAINFRPELESIFVLNRDEFAAIRRRARLLWTADYDQMVDMVIQQYEQGKPLYEIAADCDKMIDNWLSEYTQYNNVGG